MSNPYFTHGLRTYTGATVVTRVNEDIPNQGLFAGLLDIFMLDDGISPEPVKVRIPSRRVDGRNVGGRDEELIEKVNSLAGKKVIVVINKSPWAACGQSGITNYLQSIEER